LLPHRAADALITELGDRVSKDGLQRRKHVYHTMIEFPHLKPVFANLFLLRIDPQLASISCPSNIKKAVRAITREHSGSFRVSSAGSLEGSVEVSDQCWSVEGLGQKASCPAFQRLLAHVLVGEGGDENERHAGPLGSQEALQLDTVHHRHLDICNHAGRAITMA
jgi:hypothetical protein